MTIPFTFAINLPSSLDSSLLGEFASSAIAHLGSVEVTVYSYEFDGGDLGRLELDLEDVEVDLSDALCEYTINSAIERAEMNADYASETVEQKITLTQVREAYCEDRDCSPYEFLAAVGEEITMAAMNERDRAVRHELRQEVERAKASAETDKLVVEQSIQGRNKAQELYGKQAHLMRQAIDLLREARSHFYPDNHMMTPRYDDYVEMSNKITALFEQCEKREQEVAAEYFPVTETETETEAPTNSTDAEA